MTNTVIIQNPIQQVNVSFSAPQSVSVVAPTTTATTTDSQEIVNLQEILAIIGPHGPTGPSGTTVAVEYTLVAVSSWTQAHSFGYLPTVSVFANGNENVAMSVSYPTTGTVHLTFPTPFTGKVVLS
jgi:hypothetical protein